VSAPHLRAGGCDGGVRLIGRLGVTGGAPIINGMTHLLPTTCGGVKLAASQIGVKAKIAPMLDGGDVELALKTGALTMPGTRLGAITGPLRLAMRDSAISAIGNITAHDIAAGGVTAKDVSVEGRFRAPMTLSRLDGEGNVSGHGVTPDKAAYAALVNARRGVAGTLAEPLLARIEQSLRKETPRSRLEGRFNLHASEGRFSLVAPLMRLVGASGMPLLDGDRLTLVRERAMCRALPDRCAARRRGCRGFWRRFPRMAGRLPEHGRISRRSGRIADPAQGGDFDQGRTSPLAW
jgi:hypothetical protein